MLHKSIPLCLTLPEAGQGIPKEIKEVGFISDLQTMQPEKRALGDVFDWPHRMDNVLIPQIHPALLHLDAPADDALPNFLPDGQPIYPADRKLFRTLRKQVLEQYYQTYYAQIHKVLETKTIPLGLDCHIFEAEPISQDEGKPLYPRICLSNNGDALGDSRFGKGDLTCSQEILCDLRDILAARFLDTLGPRQVTLNTPIIGGHLIRTLATKDIPWIRMDIAQDLLRNDEGKISSKRIEKLRDHFENILVSLCKVYEWM
jgi:N-formylglutamate amidohydrolase